MIELPGFEMQKELGRGGMARVYLAVQRKFGRLVALKVVSSDIAKDPGFRSRFLQESRINAQLSHPNIVQVYDVGLEGDALYLVMEYIKGGDLIRRLEGGIHVQELIRIVTDVGRALDYAHNRGFIHRDIKPENILFREDGSAVLSDFGIARVVDSNPTITRAGTVVGTPQYMSPEQASGKKLDGRSDLYSLGVVFYRMLTGDVPYRADSAVTIGVKHLQEPIPRLPSYLSAFQTVIDRCLAKRPEQRYQTAAELSAALEKIKTDAPLPNATIRTQAVSTREIDAVGGSGFTAMRDPIRAKRGNRRRAKRQRTRQVVLTTLLAVAVVGGSLVSLQQPQWVSRLLSVVGVLKDPEVREAWNNARSLRQDPNQSLATIVAAHRRVLSLEPYHLGATEAVAGLANQWKQDIRAALAQGNLSLAETKLAESSQAFPDDPDLAELEVETANRQHAESLLASTQALMRSHGMSDIASVTAAIQAYQEVLRLAPEHPVARSELDSVAQHYAIQANEAADSGQMDDAIRYLDRASAANSRLPELTTVREKIRQATTVRTAIADILQQAREYRVAGALIDPPGQNAAELYHRALATDPENVVATQGLNEVLSQLNTNAAQLLAQGDLEAARALVDRASAVGLDPGSVQQIKSRLEGELKRRNAVAGYLDQAQSLLSQGYVTEPPERNAVSLLREVERTDPGNTRARLLLAQSAERLAGVAQEAYEVGMTDQAKRYLELALTITPDETEWLQLRLEWEKDSTGV